MKFGKQIKRLAAPRHLNHYIAYDVLKKAINVVFEADGDGGDIRADRKAVDDEFGQSTRVLSGAGYRPPDSRFYELLQHELLKVNRFAMLQLQILVDTLREAHRPLVMHTPDAEITPEALTTAERLLDTAAAQLVELEDYRQLNGTGFRKIVKKFDKRAASSGLPVGSLQTWFVGQLHREFFVAAKFDSHVLALAWGYAAIRRHRCGGATSFPRLRSPASTEDWHQHGPATEVFWLQPRLSMQAVCTLVKWFDLTAMMPGGSDASVTSLAEQQRRLLLALAPESWALLPTRLAATNTMHFYDAKPAFTSYAGQIRQEDGLVSRPSFRIRCTAFWGASEAPQVVERDGDAHALDARPSTTMPVRHSFPLDSDCDASDVKGLLRSARNAAAAATSDPEDAHRLALAREVEQAASSPAFSEVATVNSSRWLLRGDTPDTEGVTIALDQGLQISHPTCEDGPSGEVIDFPFSLLEVANTGGGRASGKWLEELHNHAALREVAGFSIGVHAIAELHGKDVCELPPWQKHVSYAQLEAAEVGPVGWRRTYSVDVGPSMPAAPPLAPTMFEPAVAAAAPSTVRVLEEHAEVKHIEPKNYLASERTMLEWMHTVLALALISLGLWKASLRGATPGAPDAGARSASTVLNHEDASQLALGVYGLVLLAAAVAFAWYAAWAHSRRLDALLAGKHMEVTFNSRLAPTVFAGVVGLALVVHLLVQIVPVWLALGSGGMPDAASYNTSA